jgi:hypothetical protein
VSVKSPVLASLCPAPPPRWLLKAIRTRRKQGGANIGKMLFHLPTVMLHHVIDQEFKTGSRAHILVLLYFLFILTCADSQLLVRYFA